MPRSLLRLFLALAFVFAASVCGTCACYAQKAIAKELAKPIEGLLRKGKKLGNAVGEEAGKEMARHIVHAASKCEGGLSHCKDPSQ